jgi:hypothetical protein
MPEAMRLRSPARRPLVHPGLSEESPWLRRVRHVLVAVLLVNVVLAASSGYRAWRQVYSLSLDAPTTLVAGAPLRATALGRSQWLRVPPPTIREVPVTIATTTSPP